MKQKKLIFSVIAYILILINVVSCISIKEYKAEDLKMSDIIEFSIDSVCVGKVNERGYDDIQNFDTYVKICITNTYSKKICFSRPLSINYFHAIINESEYLQERPLNKGKALFRESPFVILDINEQYIDTLLVEMPSKNLLSLYLVWDSEIYGEKFKPIDYRYDSVISNTIHY